MENCDTEKSHPSRVIFESEKGLYQVYFYAGI